MAVCSGAPADGRCPCPASEAWGLGCRTQQGLRGWGEALPTAAPGVWRERALDREVWAEQVGCSQERREGIDPGGMSPAEDRGSDSVGEGQQKSWKVRKRTERGSPGVSASSGPVSFSSLPWPCGSAKVKLSSSQPTVARRPPSSPMPPAPTADSHGRESRADSSSSQGQPSLTTKGGVTYQAFQNGTTFQRGCSRCVLGNRHVSKNILFPHLAHQSGEHCTMEADKNKPVSLSTGAAVCKRGLQEGST